MLISLLIGSGLRCAEAANLKIEDAHSGYGESFLHVSCGKGNKKRNILISSELKKHINDYKKAHCHKNDVFFIAPERGIKYTPNGIHTMVKRVFAEIGLPSRYGPHSLRHTYACLLYRHTKDLILVASQLGHSSMDTTAIYAKIFFNEDSERLKGLFDVKSTRK